ncbi:hypothetical protein ACU4GR_16080 [Methylobacterium oryzae CBMB20]
MTRPVLLGLAGLVLLAFCLLAAGWRGGRPPIWPPGWSSWRCRWGRFR